MGRSRKCYTIPTFGEKSWKMNTKAYGIRKSVQRWARITCCYWILKSGLSSSSWNSADFLGFFFYKKRNSNKLSTLPWNSYRIKKQNQREWNKKLNIVFHTTMPGLTEVQQHERQLSALTIQCCCIYCIELTWPLTVSSCSQNGKKLLGPCDEKKSAARKQ